MLSEQALSRVGQANGSDVVAGLSSRPSSSPTPNCSRRSGTTSSWVPSSRRGLTANRRRAQQPALSRTFAIIGSWLIFAPFVLRYASVEDEVAQGADVTANGTLVTVLAETASWNDVLVGIAVLILVARSGAAAGLSARALAEPAREFARRCRK